MNNNSHRPKKRNTFLKKRTTPFPQFPSLKQPPSPKYNPFNFHSQFSYHLTTTNSPSHFKTIHSHHPHSSTSPHLNTISQSSSKPTLNSSIKPKSSQSSTNFCLINKKSLKHPKHSRHKLLSLSAKKQSKPITFTNQTLSSLFKIDHTMLTINPNIKNEIQRTLFRNPRRRGTKVEQSKNNERLSTCDTLKNNIIRCIMLSQEKMGFPKRQYINYIRTIKKEITESIKRSDEFVKETVGSLRRLQKTNDENIQKLTFVKKTMFK